MTRKALFVCLGNICRSPIAEAVFLHLAKAKGLQNQWEVDSAGIGNWHVGKKPDHRAQKVLKEKNVEYHNRARQISMSDFEEFDYIFGMDNENIHDLNRLKPSDSKSEILLLGDFDPMGEKIIRDPYYDSGSDGFYQCYEQCIRCCTEFLNKH